MAKKAMINKQQRAQKYSTREYTRCSICDVRMLYFVNTESAVFVSESLLTRVRFPA